MCVFPTLAVRSRGISGLGACVNTVERMRVLAELYGLNPCLKACRLFNFGTTTRPKLLVLLHIALPL